MIIFELKDLSIYSINNLLGLVNTYKQKFLQRNIDVGDKKKEEINILSLTFLSIVIEEVASVKSIKPC